MTAGVGSFSIQSMKGQDHCNAEAFKAVHIVVIQKVGCSDGATYRIQFMALYEDYSLTSRQLRGRDANGRS